ncbi:HK97-gp10 family putative phage morphogenesis protein [Pseudonocardia lutea]|uniref:HK97-gp10 family putative phage morphogenesis protein n=1 Tax=Pseudonocardia lutea TaxID=2172015 RepID=A0ABW1I445_9PSEU
MANQYVPDPRAEAHIEAAKHNFMERLMGDIAQDAKRYAPVDTGELRESITAEVHGTTGTVKATAEHAAYVELGTRYQSAQPYLRPALYQQRGGA